jgi:type I restriction enzyme M protein
MVRLSLVNMYLHGFTTPKIYEYDSLTYTDRWGDTFDIIMANPPFMTPKGGIRPHKKFAMQANRSEVLFVDYIMEHINPTTGRAAVIVPEGIIFQSATAYKALRKLLVEKNFLYGVVSLPAGLFQPYSGVKTSILLLDRTLAKKTDKILFIKIENDGYSLGAQRKELSTSDLPDATNFIKQYITAIRNNDFSLIDFEHLPLNSIAVERNKITENGDYNLSGDRYKDSIAKKQSKFNLVELSEVCDLYQPQTISASDFKENGEYKVFGANGVIGYYDKYNHEDSEVLITCRGATCGTINFSEPKSWITGNAMVAKPIDNRINKRFLFHLLKVSDLSSVITGAAQPQITRASLSPFKIPLPPVTVQLEIEARIEQYEKIVAGAKQVVENYKPQIDIKPEWEIVELSTIAQVNDKSVDPIEAFGDTDFCYIDISSVENETGKISYNNIIPTVDAPSRARRVIKSGDILLSTVRPNLKAFAYIQTLPEKCLASTGFAVITVNSNTNSKYLYYCLFNDFVLNQMYDRMGKGSYPSINQTDVNALKIPMPHISEQEAIVAQIEKEQRLVNTSEELVYLYEQKIKDEINKLWEE